MWRIKGSTRSVEMRVLADGVGTSPVRFFFHPRRRIWGCWLVGSAGGIVSKLARSRPAQASIERRKKETSKSKDNDPSMCSSSGGLSRPGVVPHTPPAPHRHSASLLCSALARLLLRDRNRKHCIRCAGQLAWVDACNLDL